LDIFSGGRADPDIIDILTTAYRYGINPLKNIITPFLVPELDILVGSTDPISSLLEFTLISIKKGGNRVGK
jgi:hypothetical protein